MTLTFPAVLTAQTNALLSQPELDPYELKRVWFAQLKLHPVNGKIQDILLEGGQLFITTSDANLHVYNSETGQWLWTRSIGKRDLPLTEPAVNSRVVAVHNTLEVYLFNRKTGKQLLQIPLSSAASAPCEMSEHYLYVPMVNQTIQAYVLKESFTPKEVLVGAPLTEKGINNPELEKIVKDFEEAKRMLQAVAPKEVEDDDFILDSKHRIPITCATMGTLRTKPLFLSQFYSWKLDDEEKPTHEVDGVSHREFLSWVTEQGYLYSAKVEQMSETNMTALYRVDSAGQTFFLNRDRVAQIDRPGSKSLPSRPTHSQLYPVNDLNIENIIVPDMIITGGRAAYVFAIDSRTGDVRWQFPAVGQLLESIAVIGKDIYAPTANNGLHALDLKGSERWFARNVKRFVAASKDRVYVLDRQNRLVGLDRATGASRFVYDIRRFDHCLYNLETDQIFLLTNSGLVQCIREKQIETDQEPGEKTGTSLRHRISSAEFAAAARTGEMPKLWWTEETETEMKTDAE
jgi:outer membrane protein assembly factor BamB